jgi:Outer membrane lipoprotein-sorting protein
MLTIRMLRSAAMTTAAMASASIAAAQSATSTIDHATAAWAKIHSLSGTFEQTLTNPLVRSSSVSHGEFHQQRPNKLSVRFTDPAGDAIVADGKFIWIYLHQSAPNQVIRRVQNEQMDVPLDLSQFLDATTSKYDLESKGADKIDGRPTTAIALTPKKGTRAAFASATVWVDDADGLIRQFEVVEPSGVVRRVRLMTVNVNPTVKPADFDVTIPHGAKIITP